MKVIYNKHFPWGGFFAINICGLVFCRSDKGRMSAVERNHEYIHTLQQREMLYVGFYVWYVVEFIWRYLACRNWMKAYRNISFEREAYQKQHDLTYRYHRRHYNWWRLCALWLLMMVVTAGAQNVKRPLLDRHHLLLDMNVKTADNQQFVYKTFKEAVKHLGDSCVLYVAPGVYWVDDPDDPDRAYAIITLVPDGSTTPEYIRACISGIEWQEGHTYTYTISSSAYPSDYHLDVNVNPEFEYNGTVTSGKTNYFTVRSYKDSNGSQTPKRWVVDGYKLQNADGTWPDTWESTEKKMLKSLSTESGDGRTASDSPEKVTLTIWHQKKKGISQRREVELEALRKTLSEPIVDRDLSLYKVDNLSRWSGRTTANCYIVRFPGTYKIPLVIGNCYQRGSIVTPQTTSVAEGTGSITVRDNDKSKSFSFRYGPETFVNYMGQPVNSDNCIITNAKTAEIFWHDFQYVETNEEIKVIPEESLSIVTEGGLQFLKFKVDEDLIQQGNAVLAVRDAAGDIIWSWHIYITDRNWIDEVTKITNYAGNEYFVANYNLGYVEKCAAGHYTYPERYMKIRIYQPEGGLYGEVTVTQHDGEVEVDIAKNLDWDTRYQWGRKDAMPGTVAANSTLGTYFPASGYTKSGTIYKWILSAGASYALAIKNPDKRYAAGADNYNGLWSNAIYANAWSATNNKLATEGGESQANGMAPIDERPVVKTIYDPCPAGFCIPPSGAFTGFTKTGKNDVEGNISGSFNNSYNAKPNGYSFYTDGWKTGNLIIFPATGRNRDSGSAEWSTNGYVWSATPGIPGWDGTGTRSEVVWHPCSYHLSFNSSKIRPAIANNQMMPQAVRPMEDPAIFDRINHGNSDVRPYDNQDDENLRLNN